MGPSRSFCQPGPGEVRSDVAYHHCQSQGILEIVVIENLDRSMSRMCSQSKEISTPCAGVHPPEQHDSEQQVHPLSRQKDTLQPATITRYIFGFLIHKTPNWIPFPLKSRVNTGSQHYQVHLRGSGQPHPQRWSTGSHLYGTLPNQILMYLVYTIPIIITIELYLYTRYATSKI